MLQNWYQRWLDGGPLRFHYPFTFFGQSADWALAPAPPVKQRTDVLLERDFDVCPVHNNTWLPEISTPCYPLDHIWNSLGATFRSIKLCCTFVICRESNCWLFFKGLVHRRILEEVDDPCQILLHPVIVRIKKEKEEVRFPWFEQAL